MVKNKDSRQIEVLQYIYEEVQEKGYPPTVREIGNAVKLSSTSTVHGHLSRLEKNGFIQRDPTKPRAIELTQAGLDKLGIMSDKMPLLGTVTAGAPILAVEEATDYFRSAGSEIRFRKFVYAEDPRRKHDRRRHIRWRLSHHQKTSHG